MTTVDERIAKVKGHELKLLALLSFYPSLGDGCTVAKDSLVEVLAVTMARLEELEARLKAVEGKLEKNS